MIIIIKIIPYYCGAIVEALNNIAFTHNLTVGRDSSLSLC
jgi:hypothetical protein